MAQSVKQQPAVWGTWQRKLFYVCPQALVHMRGHMRRRRPPAGAAGMHTPRSSCMGSLCTLNSRVQRYPMLRASETSWEGGYR